MLDYEEAQVVHCLKTTHLLTNQEISGVLSRSTSWVSRRISFIERLSPEVQGHLQLGEITVSHARELAKLPRGKQNEFLRLIVAEKLTSRQTAFLVLKYLQAKTKQEQDYVLKSPIKVLDYYIDFTDTQSSEKITFFSYILNHSRRQYIEIVEDKTQRTLFQCLINAFLYFEGVPREIKSDNQKACVDRWELGKPVYNKTFLSFATHYRFRPLAIHPGKPRENLKVERPFYYLETNFLNARTFAGKQDMKQQLKVWLCEKNDQRIHRTTRRRPIELYRDELPALQLPPTKGWDTSVVEYRIVNNESAIRWENYYYVVPNQYMFETCPVRVKDNQIIIYNPDCQPIVTYPLAVKGSKQRYIGRAEKSQKYVLSAGEVATRLQAFGPVMQEYTAMIKQSKPTSYLYHWRQILSLKANYYADDIIVAVKRALRFRAFEAQAIVNFLTINAQKKSELTFSQKKSTDE